jgi:hypothetical protein
MIKPTLDRRHFIGGGAVAVAGFAAAGLRPLRASISSTAWSDVSAMTRPGGAPLAVRGVNYDTGTEFAGVLQPSLWNPELVASDMRAIHDQLAANAVLIVGSDTGRLREAAAAAAAAGLAVWLEPRPFGMTPDAAVEFFVEVAAEIGTWPTGPGEVVVSLSTESTIFLHGLVPGRDWAERAAALATADWTELETELNRHLASAASAVRDVFSGSVTYSAGSWEPVDWEPFDVVGVNLFRDRNNEATYRRDLQTYLGLGKPVVITEFGCCSFVGADDLGGGGFTIIDWSQAVPQLPAGTTRDEGVQARYLDELLDLYEAESVHGAFVWTFIEPESYRSDDPAQDFDMAGFAIVSCTDPAVDPHAYARTGRWEPKESFDVVARHFDGRAVGVGHRSASPRP